MQQRPTLNIRKFYATITMGNPMQPCHAQAAELEITVNQELLKRCDINKLSIIFRKTNYMIIKSAKKKLPTPINLKCTNNGSIYLLEKKITLSTSRGVFLDDTLSRKYQISHICSRISSNAGILLKLRNYLLLIQLKQLYYSLIYPYVSHAIVSWSKSYASHFKKIQTKQNHIVRLMFFATLNGETTESASPLLDLQELLTVENIDKLQVLNFSHKWHKKQLPIIFEQHFRYTSDVHKYNTRYVSKANFDKSRYRTDIGKQTTKAMMATDTCMATITD